MLSRVAIPLLAFAVPPTSSVSCLIDIEAWDRPSNSPAVTTVASDLLSGFNQIAPIILTAGDRLVEVVWRLSRLSADWDGYGANALDESSIEDAVAFAEMLPDGICLPLVAPVSSGAVALYWRTRELMIEVEFDGSGFAHIVQGTYDPGAEILSFQYPISARSLEPFWNTVRSISG